MLNRYPLWKYGLIVLVLSVMTLYALPNLYPDDPAVQISSTRTTQVDQAMLDRLGRALDAQGLEVKRSDLLSADSGLIRLQHADDQLAAQQLVKAELGSDYVVALNLASTTPQWLRDLGGHPMNLGLDLSGGVHFLLEVDMEKAVSTRLDLYASEIRAELRKAKIRYRSAADSSSGQRQLSFASAGLREEAIALIRKQIPELALQLREENGQNLLAFTLAENTLKEIQEYALKQNLTTIRNRVNELGVSEPLVQRQGRNRIVVELPGVQDTAQAKGIIGKTANLEFRLEALPDAPKASSEEYNFRSGSGRSAALERDIILTGDRVANARTGFDSQTGQPEVQIDLDGSGGDLMNRATRHNVGRRMAVIYVEQKPVTRYRTVEQNGEQVREPYQGFREEKGIISLATIQSALGKSFRITGLDSAKEASELSLLLRSGALAAPMYFVEERTVGPSLGADNIEMGIKSALAGLALVMLAMVLVYKVFGLIACGALLLNLMVVMALMSMLGATLTLPGIAGIVLTIGMAVDANVLIFSRIREELANGLSVQRAIHEGYDRAFVSIFDANLTTLIVAVILYAIGTGPVKGFAVTLSLGIITSMFTAIMVSRAMVNLIYGGRQLKKIAI